MIRLQLEPWKLLQKLVEDFIAVIPNLLGAIVIFIIGWLLARIIAKLVRRFLVTIGADRLAERLNEIDIVYQNNIKVVPSILLSKLTYYLLMFIFVIAATDVLNMPVISDLISDVLNYVPVLISAVLVLVVGLLACDVLKNIVKTACDSLAVPASGLIANFVFYFLLINVVLIALSQAKIDTDFIQDNLSILLAGVVLAFSIGYGFASRSIVANFLASFYNRGKIQVGDTIEIDGVSGEVISMDSGVMTILSDGREVMMPLSRITTEKVIFLKKNA